MDIRNWPQDKLLELPDCCFGRRFPIIFSGLLGAGATGYFINELALPDRCILWEVNSFTAGISDDAGTHSTIISLGLSDRLPTSDTEFALLENILPGLDEITNAIRAFRSPLHLSRLRLPVIAQGRRVALRTESDVGSATEFSVGLVFSSIPREIPDPDKWPRAILEVLRDWRPQ